MLNLFRKTRTNSWFHAAVFFLPALIIITTVCSESVDYFAPGGREQAVLWLQASMVFALIYWLLVCICGLHLLSFLWDRKHLEEKDKRYIFYNAYPWFFVVLFALAAEAPFWFFEIPAKILEDFWDPFLR